MIKTLELNLKRKSTPSASLHPGTLVPRPFRIRPLNTLIVLLILHECIEGKMTLFPNVSNEGVSTQGELSPTSIYSG